MECVIFEYGILDRFKIQLVTLSLEKLMVTKSSDFAMLYVTKSVFSKDFGGLFNV